MAEYFVYNISTMGVSQSLASPIRGGVIGRAVRGEWKQYACDRELIEIDV